MTQRPQKERVVPQRERVVPHKFFDFEMHSNEQVDDDGDLVHITLVAGVEPIDEKEAMT